MKDFINDVVTTIEHARNSLAIENEVLQVKRTIAYAILGYLRNEGHSAIEYAKTQSFIGYIEHDTFTLWSNTENLKSNLLLILKQCDIDISEFD